MSERVRKSLELRQAAIEENILRGDPAVMGNMDRGGDVILPGAFKSVRRPFLADGFVAYGHEWYEPPIAMPTKLEERGRALYAEARFHSTDRAQEVRTICQERLAQGLSVGLSIGFGLDAEGRAWFETGKALWEWVSEQEGFDEALYDKASITKWPGQCRAISRVADLYEFSVVSVPMNPEAVMSDAKQVHTLREFEAFLRDAGFSRSQAALLAGHGWKVRDPEDAGGAAPQGEPGAANDDLQAQVRAQYARYLATDQTIRGVITR